MRSARTINQEPPTSNASTVTPMDISKGHAEEQRGAESAVKTIRRRDCQSQGPLKCAMCTGQPWSAPELELAVQAPPTPQKICGSAGATDHRKPAREAKLG